MDYRTDIPPTFSFVVPVYNEQDVLETFYSRLTAEIDKLGEPSEIVFVNDGSSDGTAAILRRLAGEDRRVRVVEFSRNFGHQTALTAGYDFAAGRAVISLDADCQHPPELIGQLVARWREGFEVVYTVRTGMPGESGLYARLRRLGYRLLRLSSGQDLSNQADFRLLDRKALDALKAHRESGRFLRGLVRHIGFRQSAVPYKAARRAAGKRSYTMKQTLEMSAVGAVYFSLKPLRLAYGLGGLLLCAAAVYAVAALALWGMGRPLPWPASLAAGIAALFGCQFLLLGLLGEYVGRTFEQTKGRPLYVVRETIGFAPAAGRSARDGESRENRYVLYT